MNQKIFENCKLMLEARKYKNIQQSEMNDLPIFTATGAMGKVMVVFLGRSRLNIGIVKECISMFTEEQISYGILVHDEEPTSSAKKTLQYLDSTGKIRISSFLSKQFMYHLLDHELVVPHVKAKKEESVIIKNKYGADKLPILLSSDVMARYYNFRSGDIIRITRKKWNSFL